MIKPCDGARCDSAYQDKKYGRGMRVHNETNNGRRCTVCGNSVTGAKTYGKPGK